VILIYFTIFHISYKKYERGVFQVKKKILNVVKMKRSVSSVKI